MKLSEILLSSAQFITVCTPDFCGRLMGKRRPVADWPQLSEQGLIMPDFHLVTGIENRPLPGFAAAGIEQGFRNGWLRPEPAAAFVSPIEPDTMHVIGDVLTADRIEVEEAPRAILKAQLVRLQAQGLTARCASELEFYLVRQSYRQAHAQGYTDLEPIYHRHGDNDVLVASLGAPFCNGIERALAVCGIKVEQFQGEGGTGQFEVNVAPADPLQAADDHIVFKHVVKSSAHASGSAATFLAKPFEVEAGSGGHIHMSLRTRDGSNALGLANELTPFGRSFLAGVIAFTPELTLLHAPYANSYKRLVPRAFAPLWSTWGWDNRTAMVRLIAGADGPRLEFRLPGADVNPYHSYAAILAAGLAGIEDSLSLPKEKQGGMEPSVSRDIPGDLTESIARFASSAMARGAFGDRVHAHLLQHARHELAATRQTVTSWEVARGFESA